MTLQVKKCAGELTNRFMDDMIKPLIKDFIATLRWVLEETENDRKPG